MRTTAIRNLHMQGALTSTGNKLDLALNGRGWFQVAGANGEQFYTRAGAFNKNATGQIVTADGYVVQPAMTIPQNATEVIVNETGQVYVRTGTDTTLQLIGQLTLANFTNEAGLDPLGGNLYRETTASGTPVTGVPGDPGFGSVHQGYLETLQRRCRQGDHRADLGAARLRDELQGHPGVRRDVRHRRPRACAKP